MNTLNEEKERRRAFLLDDAMELPQALSMDDVFSHAYNHFLLLQLRDSALYRPYLRQIETLYEVWKKSQSADMAARRALANYKNSGRKRSAGLPACPSCGSVASVIKKGHTAANTQRYCCLYCKKTFI